MSKKLILYEDGVLVEYQSGKLFPMIENTTIPVGSSKIHHSFVHDNKIYFLNLNQKVKVFNMNKRGFDLLNSVPPFDFNANEMINQRNGPGIAIIDYYWIVGVSVFSQLSNMIFHLIMKIINQFCVFKLVF